MAMLQANALTPRPAAPALPGTWKLAAGRAITLEPREPGVLKVAHGQLWATFDSRRAGGATDHDDHFYGAGDQVRLRAGERVVIESWNHGAPAYFSWDPLPARQTVAREAYVAVVQPLADLRHALALATDAVGRLVTGVGRIGWHALAHRDGKRLEEQACGKHGALG